MEPRAVGDARLFAGVFEASPDAIVVTDAGGTVVAANARCEAVFGLSADALVGRPVETLVPEAARAGHPARRDRFSGPHAHRPMGLLQLAAARADGTEFPAEISLARIEVRGETYVCATVRDVTERRRQERQFRELIEAAPDPTVIVDGSGVIVQGNRQVDRVFGYQPGELVGSPIEHLVPERFRHGHVAQRSGYVGAPVIRGMGQGRELHAVRKDGSEFPVEISLSPIETDDGLLVAAAIRDVSERRRIQQTADRIRDEFLATVSHELRTPLTSIVGYAELLGDLGEDEIGPQARRMLQVIDRNARRELRLVNDLLTLARLQEEGLHVELATVDLLDVVRAAVEDARLAARGRGIEVTVEAAPGADLTVRGDPGRLGQVVGNLLGNAVKFTPPGGRVLLGLAAVPGGVIELRVCDTGPGMGPEEVEQAFDRLYRAPAAVRDQVPGAGLGLSIARAVVDAHGGTIEVGSELGAGTTVTVRLAAANR
ncbi:PAS domain S-box protein [Nocardioides marmotae]|uniref:PAS domain S-box protein n=1 Tax=Nocardioides marmotae TaxID=2663857 RepID=UPI0012B57EA2|nr:PAS domain S-box protein [Nocardioides marmotae]MBC9733159.1 PAS domain S-box protein [Nocardioides marmotae]MTB84271.1 PAS domain S-box protein [Nocardioides marmotae]